MSRRTSRQRQQRMNAARRPAIVTSLPTPRDWGAELAAARAMRLQAFKDDMAEIGSLSSPHPTPL